MNRHAFSFVVDHGWQQHGSPRRDPGTPIEGQKRMREESLRSHSQFNHFGGMAGGEILGATHEITEIGCHKRRPKRFEEAQILRNQIKREPRMKQELPLLNVRRKLDVDGVRPASLGERTLSRTALDWLRDFEIHSLPGVLKYVGELKIFWLEPFPHDAGKLPVDRRRGRHVKGRQCSDLHTRIPEGCRHGRRSNFERGQASHDAAFSSRSTLNLRIASTGWPKKECGTSDIIFSSPPRCSSR